MRWRREMPAASRVRRPGAERPRGTGPAGLEAEAHERIRFALPIALLAPPGRDLALRAPGLALRPRDRALGAIVGPGGLGVPALARPWRAAQREAVVIAAGGEQGRTDRGAIDEMCLRGQVFRA